jgi:hypothetical protein
MWARTVLPAGFKWQTLDKTWSPPGSCQIKHRAPWGNVQQLEASHQKHSEEHGPPVDAWNYMRKGGGRTRLGCALSPELWNRQKSTFRKCFQYKKIPPYRNTHRGKTRHAEEELQFTKQMYRKIFNLTNGEGNWNLKDNFQP